MNVLVLGAGQLARMMALEAKPLNIDVIAYDVGSEQIVDPLRTNTILGNLTDSIEKADVITAEFEHISHQVLAACEASGKLYPSSQSIKTGGDRRLEKQVLANQEVPNARHVVIESKQDFDNALSSLSLPLIFKSALAGYDGKGQWRLKSLDQADTLWADMETFMAEAPGSTKPGIIAEEMVPFDREVSLVGVRGKNGDTAAYPLTENHHTDGVLSVSIALDDNEELQKQAAEIFDKVADELKYVGVLAIEFFQVGDKLLVNEIAPRVHNSGHWSQQGTDCSQFANHIRAVAGLPLGNTDLLRPTSMINVLGEDTLPNTLLAIPGLNIHWYGKSKRAGRKMGHINVSANSRDELNRRMGKVANQLSDNAFADIKQYIANRFSN